MAGLLRRGGVVVCCLFRLFRLLFGGGFPRLGRSFVLRYKLAHSLGRQLS